MHQLVLIAALSATTGLCGGHKKANCAPVCAPAVVSQPCPPPVCAPRVKKHCGLKLGGMMKKHRGGCATPAPVCDTAYAAPVYAAPVYAAPMSSPQAMPTPQAPSKQS